MNQPSTREIRQTFLDFFRERGHEIVPSASLVPGNDPTLLFTNSGMVPFKDVFLGAEKRSYVRAADVQRCLRAGGKHNDLDQVGYTARHHTFFEMLGNWSFGDYFKKDAIVWSWELLTNGYGIAADRLLVTVYHDDDEAFAIWRDVIGLPEHRIIRIGDNKGAKYASDNFWQMADTGPCGPCTEIFYDHGENVPGGPPGSPDEDGDRFIEIWNLVFMQFDRAADGTLSPLPAPCVDTGMGLERLAAVLQGVHSNYEIDLFQKLIAAAAELTGTEDHANKSLRVIADHIRACSFLIVDGVLPSNEGRGYVLRRIIRRALRHGWMLGVRGSFFHKMLAPLLEEMGDIYPELAAKAELIERALKNEEQRFAETLDHGMRVFDEIVAANPKQIPGDDAFRLYDTYGFPVDLTADMARERGMDVDMAGFEAAMNEQRERARAASSFGGGGSLSAELVARLPATEFLGYEHLEADDCRVLAILQDGKSVDRLDAGAEAELILDRTPFYGESGGQVGDAGELHGADGLRFSVADTRKYAGAYHAHVGKLEQGILRVGEMLDASIDGDRRQRIVLNHSATHLLHAALREVLGDHVQQKGSLVATERLRFDFSHFEAVTREQLREIEHRVNAEIRANHAADIRHMGMQEALDFGAMALFGEKYGERVRVLKLGDGSIELCGGTHVDRTGDIGLFRIVSEGGISAGVRRIEAVTGDAALSAVEAEHDHLDQLASLLGGSAQDATEKLKALLDRAKRLEKEVDVMKAGAAADASRDLAEKALEIEGIRLVAARLDGLDAKALRDSVDQLKDRLRDAVVLLASGSDGKVSLIAGVAGAAQGKVKAGDLIRHVADAIGGKGGGRPDMAQGGGPDGPAVAEAMAGIPQWVGERVSAG